MQVSRFDDLTYLATNYLVVNDIQTTEMVIHGLGTVESMDANSLSVNTIETSEPYDIPDTTVVQSATAINTTLDNPTVTTLTASNITLPSLTVDTIDVTRLHQDTSSSTNTTTTSSTSDNINTNSINATEITATSANVTGTLTSDNMYTTLNYTGQRPNVSQGVATFQGTIGCKSFDFLQGTYPSYSVLLNHNQTVSQTPLIIGYNSVIGGLDNGTFFGGVKAALSLCSNSAVTARTLRFNEDGNFVVYSPTGTVLWQSGTSVSDETLKRNISYIDNCADKLSELECFWFKYKEEVDPKRLKRLGLSAQTIQKVQPEIVHEDTKGYLSLKMERCVPLLVNGIKELSSKQQEVINKLESEIEEMQNVY